MKYRFEKNRKQLSSDRVKSNMDFKKVMSKAGAAGSGKMNSPELHSKWSLSVSTTVLSTAAVMTFLVVAGPALLKSENNPLKWWATSDPIEEVEKPQEIIVETPKKVTPPVLEIEEAPVERIEVVEPVEKEVPQVELKETVEEEAEESINYEDVLVRAYPLPDLESFLNAIDEELIYPEEARKDSTQGFVRVFFKVNKEGVPEDFKINKSLGELFDNEAIRVLKTHRDWEPASFNGQAVDSYFTIKVLFEFEQPLPGDTIRYY